MPKFVLVLLALCSIPNVVLAAEQPKLSLLIVDGVNNHDWPRATKILREILEGSGHFRVEVSTSPTANSSQDAWDKWRPDFTKYDVVLSNFNGGHTAKSVHWPKEVEKALEDYVRGGGGLVIYHSANNSFLNWAAYNEMIGLGWRDKNFGPSLIVSPEEKVVEIPKGEGRNPGHGPEHDFQITVPKPDHPITKGLPKKWMHPHEQLTHGQHGPAKNLTVLTYAWSKDVKESEPMDWVIPYGKGRVYVTMLGHLWKDGPDTAMRCVGFQTLLVRGCEWAATGKVTYPVPKDFPTASETSLAPAIPTSITTKKPEDRVEAETRQGTATLTISSPSGIGGAAISLNQGPVVLRLRLKGLESLTISNGKVTLGASVSSRGDQRVYLKDGDQEKPVGKDSRYWTTIKVVQPLNNGYFEMAVPEALLKDGGALTISWIDFYRG